MVPWRLLVTVDVWKQFLPWKNFSEGALYLAVQEW